ncbi:hypothetical protein Sjap_024963 [Stephania japonica]|uniref:Uncharacterized protein n=1 Tax=Stephania japonica TaxID=461633 RepID=A0AAP0HPH1_9MAGN
MVAVLSTRVTTVEVGDVPKRPSEPWKHLNAAAVNREANAVTGTRLGRHKAAHWIPDSPGAPPHRDLGKVVDSCCLHHFYFSNYRLFYYLVGVAELYGIADRITITWGDAEDHTKLLFESHNPGVTESVGVFLATQYHGNPSPMLDSTKVLL